MRFLNLLVSFMIALFFMACSSIEVLSHTKKIKVEKSDKREKKYSHKKTEKVHKKNKKRPSFRLKEDRTLVSAPSLSKSKKDKNNDQLYLEYNKKYYKFWINYFTKRDKKRFIRHLENGEKYRPLIEKIFKQEGLPKDLYYLGLIESGYNMRIKSRAKATGPWQFMKGTGKHYGLRIDRSIDERTNIHKATLAAAQYFKDLYNIFGSWELAISAYNAGEYRVIKSIRKGNTRDYHELINKKLLPKETRYYIPKIMAAKYLASNLHMLGIKKVRRNEKEGQIYNDSKVFLFEGKTTLKNISNDLKLPYSLVKKLNNDVRFKSFRGTRKRPFKIILPIKVKGRFVEVNKVLPRQKRKRVSKKIYKVSSGDNLIQISKKFGVSVSSLKYLNSLNRKGKIMIGQKIKIPLGGKSFYIVKKGDNLTYIARKFRISITKLLSLNDLKSRVIYPKQRLLIPSRS